jgi:hypothetical protein
VLYLKADKATHDARVKAGARPFQPFPRSAERQGQDAVLQRPGRESARTPRRCWRGRR